MCPACETADLKSAAQPLDTRRSPRKRMSTSPRGFNEKSRATRYIATLWARESWVLADVADERSLTHDALYGPSGTSISQPITSRFKCEVTRFPCGNNEDFNAWIIHPRRARADETLSSRALMSMCMKTLLTLNSICILSRPSHPRSSEVSRILQEHAPSETRNVDFPISAATVICTIS